MPRKFILDSLRWLMPGRDMMDIIFCIQLSPVIRLPGFTNVWRPQKVTKTLVGMPIARGRGGQDHRGPGLLEVAAVADDRDARGLGLGLGGRLGDAGSVSGAAGGLGERSSVDPYFFGGRSGTRRRPTVCSTSSLPVVLDQAAKSLTDPGSVARTSSVWPDAQGLDGLGGLDDRHRAVEPAGIDLLVGHGGAPFPR